MKKYLIIFLSTILIIFCGCTQGEGSNTGTSPSATQSSSVSAYEKPNEELSLAPDITGTQKQVQETGGLQKVVYAALSDNPYGLAEGAYAGEYKKNVSVNGVQTGGVALKGAVAEYLLHDALNAITSGPKIKIALPLDIAEAGLSAASVEFGPYAMSVSCETAVTVLWNVPDTEIIRILPASNSGGENFDFLFDVWNAQAIEDAENPDVLFQKEMIQLADGEFYEIENHSMTDDTMLHFLRMTVSNGAVVTAYGADLQGIVYVQRGKPAPDDLFGHSAYDDASGVAKNVSVSCMELRGGNSYTITQADLLTVAGIPVFLTE